MSSTAAIRLIYCNISSHDFHYSAQINVTITADNVNFAIALVLKLQTDKFIFDLQYLFSCIIKNCFSIFHFKQHHHHSNQTTASFTNSLRVTEDTAHSRFIVFIKGPLICKDNLILFNLLLMKKHYFHSVFNMIPDHESYPAGIRPQRSLECLGQSIHMVLSLSQ